MLSHRIKAALGAITTVGLLGLFAVPGEVRAAAFPMHRELFRVHSLPWLMEQRRKQLMLQSLTRAV
jgi:hypothetical protein